MSGIKVRVNDNGGFTISGCSAEVSEKLEAIIRNADPDAINYLAARLDGLTPGFTERLEALLECIPDEVNSIGRLIDFTYNVGVYELYSGVHNAEDLARHYIYDSGLIQMPEEWAEGIDLEKFGKNLEKHEPGHYTKLGYLIATGLDWKPVFEASGEIPSEYKL